MTISQTDILRQRTSGFFTLDALRPSFLFQDDIHCYYGRTRIECWGALKVTVCLVCGNTGHAAMRSRSYTFAPLHCHETGKMWLCKAPDIIGTMEAEEVQFNKLLHRFNDVTVSTAEEAFRLRSEQGCPDDFIERLLNDTEYARFLQLKEHDAQQSRKFSSMSKEIFYTLPI